MAFFEFYKNGYIIRIKASPNASCCACKGVVCDANEQEYLKVMLNAAPENGKANKELLKWLAKNLRISKSSFTIISGESDHFKKIFVTSDESGEIEAALVNLAEGNGK